MLLWYTITRCFGSQKDALLFKSLFGICKYLLHSPNELFTKSLVILVREKFANEL